METFTMKFKNAENLIYFTTFEMGWETNWGVLSFLDDPFEDVEDAKKFVRNNLPHKHVGLATFDQMRMNNAQWDNM